MKRLLLALLTVVLLCSCSTQKVNIDNADDVKINKLAIDEPIFSDFEFPDIVSDLAIEDFLLPFDKFSWEREFDIEYVVVHFTSDVVSNRKNPYDMERNKQIFIDAEVSVHYIIDREGVIRCFIPENYAAWHAGRGTFANDEKYTNKMNKYSIGIELLAIGSQSDMSIYLTPAEYRSLDKELIGYTDLQYVSLKKLLKDICQRNNIPYDRNHIIGHEDYSPHKTDPGELFDWNIIFE